MRIGISIKEPVCYFDDRATLMNKNGQRVTLESRKNKCQLLG
ncbi:MAG: hypothetical protein ACR5LA_08705 [Wolbachia sp.]